MSYEFGKRLREIREAANIKQAEIADKLGVHFVTVSKWERGINEPCITDIKKLVLILNTTLDDLFDY